MIPFFATWSRIVMLPQSMIIISQYKLKRNSESEFFVKSSETSFCPVCGGALCSRDRRRRKVILKDGRCIVLFIRRLRCKNCGKIHAELPNLVQPFKHYASSVIQKVLNGHSEDCCAEDSTIRRWLHEFENRRSHMDAALSALLTAFLRKSGNLLSPVSLLTQIQLRRPLDWYPFVTRILVNHGFAASTQFAFCPDGASGKIALT